MTRTFLTLCFAFHCATRGVASSLTGLSAVSITDNGYTNVAVAIQPGVPQSDELIDKIKEMFTEASGHLYQATNHRLFFRNVTIFVPQTWPPNASYLTHSIARFENADVVVVPSNGRSPSPPYTRQHRGCGQAGLNINFIDSLLLAPNIGNMYATLGHLLIHEWGHYRWGLFDESPDDVNDHFYHSSLTNRFEGARCSYNITGTPLTLDNDGVTYRDCFGNSSAGYEDGCLFVPSGAQHEATGSVMYGQGKYDTVRRSDYRKNLNNETITDFCGTEPNSPTSRHNHEAPNRHNRLCDRRSNWEVMREHSDLKDGNNPARELSSSDLRPAFQVVQRGLRRIVLALETSRNMEGDPFNWMVSAATAFISWEVPVGVSVGVVGYKDTAIRLSGVVEIQSDADRQALLDALPTETNGFTSLGGGLYKAMELLEEDGSDTEGDRILLINGNEGTIFPSVGFVEARIIEANVIVDTVAMTRGADPELSVLSQKTGGHFYFASNDSGTAHSLNEAFKGTIDSSDVSDSDKALRIWSKSWTLPPGESRCGTAYLDDTVGKETQFTVSWLQQDSSATPDVKLIDPKGSTLTTSYPGYNNDTNFGHILYRLGGIAEEGQWTIEIENTDLARETVVRVSVTSFPRDADVPPISVTSSISELKKDFTVADVPLAIYAEVRQGYRQVVNATVTALVSIPTVSNPVEVQLFDTGTGADVTRNDGIYSGYYTNYTVDGFYGVVISVENNGDATVVGFPSASSFVGSNGVGWRLKSRDTSEASSPRRNDRAVGTVPAPIFRRVVSAGSSRIVNVPAAGTDAFRPGKITDLRVATSSFADKTVTLSWTATGDDFDRGIASSYELTRGSGVDAILTNNGSVAVHQSDIIRGDLSDPKGSGSAEEFTVTVPVDAGISPFAFSVIALDDAGLKSPLSNIALVTVRSYIPTPPDASTTTEPSATRSATESNSTNATETTTVGVSIPVLDTEEPSLNTRDEIIIILGVLGSVGLLTAGVLASVSIAKYYSSHKVAPSRSGSGRSSKLLWESERHVDLSTTEVTDLEMQGTESELENI